MLALFRGLPAVSRLGAALTAFGLAIDIAVHAAGGEVARGAAALIGHLVTFAGMAVAVAGVMWLGLRGSPGTPARERRG